jgi:DNA-binding MarR family transcriptional regulator/predicted GNAT family acetyltransferase
MDHDEAVERVRRFNRFYTRMIGVLNETLTQSEFTLAQSRVLFELGHRDAPTASEIAQDLRLDPAYLARILRRFKELGLVTSGLDTADRRRRRLDLTADGQAMLAELQRRSRAEIGTILTPVDAQSLETLTEAMERIETVMGAGAPWDGEIVLRPHVPGDIGWVISRQSSLYAEEFGWSIEFEGLLCEICAGFIRDFDPAMEACWIAERGEERLGAVFLFRQDDQVAKLRMLYVEKTARGKGVGRRLVAACIERARQCGYGKLVLWTNDILVSARRIYEAEGFQLVDEERHHSFGVDLVGQTWELEL